MKIFWESFIFSCPDSLWIAHTLLIESELVYFFIFFFSCPQQFNRWPCHSLTMFDNFDNFWQLWQLWHFFTILTIWPFWQLLKILTVFDNHDKFWQCWMFLIFWQLLTIFLLLKFVNFVRIFAILIKFTVLTIFYNQLISFVWQFTILTIAMTILENWNIWDNENNSDNWEPEFRQSLWPDN